MTKVFYGNQYVGSLTVDGSKPRKYTRMQIFTYKLGKFTKKTLIVLAVIQIASWSLIGAYSAGMKLNPVTVLAERIVEVERTVIPPVLSRIAVCESSTGHYKNGQVVVRGNSNGSTDIGKYQINSIWNKKASEMGLDLSKEADNEAFAVHLYENRGTEDWYSSKKCWNTNL